MSSKLITQCWFFDSDAFQPSASQVKLLLDTLPEVDQTRVKKYRAMKDQKLSLISALVQRAKVRQTFNCSDDEFTIKRSSYNKPFATSESIPILQWNYNVSHHGSYVTILSDPQHIIGVDLVQRNVRKSWKNNATKYINQFTQQLTYLERQACLKHIFEWEKYTHFFVIWSLKEAYIKAVGKGLYMDLLSVSFDVEFQKFSSDGVVGTAIAKIDRQNRSDWEFSFSSLDTEHVLAVAKHLGRGENILHKQNSEGTERDVLLPTQVYILDLLSPADQVNWKMLEEESDLIQRKEDSNLLVSGDSRNNMHDGNVPRSAAVG